MISKERKETNAYVRLHSDMEEEKARRTTQEKRKSVLVESPLHTYSYFLSANIFLLGVYGTEKIEKESMGKQEQE
jgi:hypothetical protein